MKTAAIIAFLAIAAIVATAARPRPKVVRVFVTVHNPRQLRAIVVWCWSTNGFLQVQDIGKRRIACFTNPPSPCWFQSCWYNNTGLPSPVSDFKRYPVPVMFPRFITPVPPQPESPTP